MTFTTKAIFTALVLSLTPAVASAQSFMQPGPGAQINGIAIPNTAQGYLYTLPGQVPTGAPVQVSDCGAHQYQGFVGQGVGAMQSYGIQARYFTPDMPYGTMDYQPQRLNVSTDANYIIDRVYCG